MQNVWPHFVLAGFLNGSKQMEQSMHGNNFVHILYNKFAMQCLTCSFGISTRIRVDWFSMMTSCTSSYIWQQSMQMVITQGIVG